MKDPTPEQLAQWQQRAADKGAIVPRYWEVSPVRVLIDCGACGERFARNLVPYVNDPTFVCPDAACGAVNWVPVRYQRRG